MPRAAGDVADAPRLTAPTRALAAGVLVAAHAGATRPVRGTLERLRVWSVMRLLAPLLCRALGYMPGRRVGLGEDLPRGVMLQWSRWTTLPRYFYDDPAMHAAQRAARVDQPLLVLGFDDDPWANPTAVSLLLGPVVNARIERHDIAPADAGLAALGHMGFFRKRSAATLWPRVADWLLAQCAVQQGAQ